MDAIAALGQLADTLEKAGPHKYISRRKVGGKWVYTYPEDLKGRRPARPQARVDTSSTVSGSDSDWARTRLDDADFEDHSDAAMEEATLLNTDAKTLALRGEFEAAVKQGKFEGSFAKHIGIAQDELDSHESAKNALVGELEALSAAGAKVKARTKKLDSVIGKMLRKPKYKDASMLQDLTGARIILNSVDDVKKTVAAIKQKYKVVEEDNYIDTPQGDYRSHHLIIEHRGKQKEVQVRTGNQNTFADWAHDVYKPVNTQQEAAIKEALPEIQKYSKQAADFFWAKDSGAPTDPPSMPPCTKVISQAFGCLEGGV